MVEDHNNTFKSYFQLADESTFINKLDKEGYYTMSLWEFANIFGPFLQEDCIPPVENMKIIIEDENSTQLIGNLLPITESGDR